MKEARWHFIRTKFGGKTIKAKQVLLAVQYGHERSVTQATIYRDLEVVGAKADHGSYKISE